MGWAAPVAEANAGRGFPLIAAAVKLCAAEAIIGWGNYIQVSPRKNMMYNELTEADAGAAAAAAAATAVASRCAFSAAVNFSDFAANCLS